MNSVLAIHSLGKSYREWGSEWRRIASWFFKSIQPREEKWVLQDIHFSAEKGEAIGVIGQNGAGKSTLLKLIAGITRPTRGDIEVKGRVSAILELGMGFNPDFTGRQNAYHAAGLMGYSQEDIANKMLDIETFAEIGDYFDQPMRTYSSGMQMRVAFSVATAFRPDILIVDEALSVGDIYFQQKCFQRIREYNAKGTTLLFVTHDIVGILEICSRAIYLRQGKMVIDGTPHVAAALYQADVSSRVTQEENRDSSSQPGDLITKAVTCVSAHLKNDKGEKTLAILNGHRTTLVIRYKVHRNLADPHVGFKIHNRLGNVIFETNTYCMKKTVGAADLDSEIEVHFHFRMDLAPGEYNITVGLANQGFDRCEFKEFLSYLHHFLAFTVLPNDETIVWSGIINIHPEADARVSKEPVLTRG